MLFLRYKMFNVDVVVPAGCIDALCELVPV